MPVRVRCPHCRTPCLVAEQHLGMPVKCGHCARTFRIPPPAQKPALPAVPRLDLGAAARHGSEDNFLVRHLVWTHLDERHELAVLVIADGPLMRSAVAGLTPLLSRALDGASQDTAGVSEVIAGIQQEALRKGTGSLSAVVVVWDGQVYAGRASNCRMYHHHGGQLAALPAEEASQLDPAMYRRTLAAGDRFVVVSGDLFARLDVPTLQGEITQGPPSAAEMAEYLITRAGSLRGSANGTAVIAHCY